MTTQAQISPKGFIANRKIVVLLVILLAVLLTSGFVWLQTDHVIAPPGLRIVNGLWQVYYAWKDYVCHYCVVYPGYMP